MCNVMDMTCSEGYLILNKLRRGWRLLYTMAELRTQTPSHAESDTDTMSENKGRLQCQCQCQHSIYIAQYHEAFLLQQSRVKRTPPALRRYL